VQEDASRIKKEKEMYMKYGVAQREGQPLRLFNTLREITEHYLKCAERNEKSPFYYDTEEPVFLYKRSTYPSGPHTMPAEHPYQFVRMMTIRTAEESQRIADGFLTAAFSGIKK